MRSTAAAAADQAVQAAAEVHQAEPAQAVQAAAEVHQAEPAQAEE